MQPPIHARHAHRATTDVLSPSRTSRLLRPRATPSLPASDGRLGFDLSHVTAFAPKIQRKPSIGAPDDAFEREADAVADRVMRMAEPSSSRAAPGAIQRKCATCADEEKIQTKHATHASADTAPDVQAATRAAGHDGQPLPGALRAYFEPRFGRDFSRVRIHADGEAAQAARAVQARAYTLADHVVFGAGQYAPGTADGKRLLAHELTHVVQQGRAGASRLQRAPDDKHAPKDAGTDAPKDAPRDAPKDTPKETPKDEPKDAAKDPPKDVAAKGPCGGTSLASTVGPSDKRMNGSAVTATVDATDFGNTSKLGADFKFGACKVGTEWRFHLDGLVVPVVSKVQDATFRTNVADASDAIVTKATYQDIVADLSPTRKGTFPVACGADKFKDKVTTYSKRDTYWNQQLVIDHEAFHRKNWVEMYRTELATAESDIWAHTLPASEAANAAAAVAKANSALTKYMTDAYGRLCKAYGPKKESRAYDNGAPAYQKLVDAINARAKKEKW